MIKIEIAEPKDSQKWNTLVKNNLDSTFYHLWEWSRILSLTYGYQSIHLQVKKGDTLLCVLPLIHVKSRIFGNRILSLPFCEHGGPITNLLIDSAIIRSAIKSIIKSVNKIGTKFKVDFIELRNPPLLSYTSETLHNNNFIKFQQYITFKLNLTIALEKIWNKMSKNRKRAIKRAIKTGLIIDEVQTYKELKIYYELYLKTQVRHGSPPNSYSFFKTIFDILYLKKMCKILIAKYQSRIVGGAIVFHYNDTIYWWNAVMDDNFRHINPTDLLLWEIIEWGAKNKFKFFDFGRTRHNTTIYRYKEAWGGQKIPLYDFIHFLKKKERPDPTQKKYEYMARIWSLIPTSITRRVGPRIIKEIAL